MAESAKTPSDHEIPDAGEIADVAFQIPEVVDMVPPTQTGFMSRLAEGRPAKVLLGAGAAAAGAATFGASEARAVTPNAPTNRSAVVQPTSQDSSKVSFEQFVRMNKGDESAEAARRILTSSSNESNKNPGEGQAFTANFFKEISANAASSLEGKKSKTNPQLVACNCIAIVDSGAQIYRYADPTLNKYSKVSWFTGGNYAEALANAGIYGYSEDKVLPLNRPLLKYDGKHWWLGATTVSSGDQGGGGYRSNDGYGHPAPVGQATLQDQFKWYLYDPDHIKLYQYQNQGNWHGPQAFVGLRVGTAGPNKYEPQSLYDYGIYHDFVSDNGGPLTPLYPWTIRPQAIAGYLSYHPYNWNGEMTTDGGQYGTKAWAQGLVRMESTKPYVLSYDINKVRQEMIKDIALQKKPL